MSESIMFNYKAQNPLEKRKAECESIMKSWPDRIPIILEKDPRSQLESIQKFKFLCPYDYTVQKFLTSIRLKVNLPKDVALFLFVNGIDLMTGDSTMKEIYERKKDEDGFIYLNYSDHPVLGG
ncbi:unnamed protein product [Blepharisma stoltei]|uniref:Autophagy-related protein n=1 Tax=Blepharisma stoltei TaxID=1481888 RepID=A0AAU9JFE5_9CILI|nr:unnamed protein product [Blepharisma stoltei]